MDQVTQQDAALVEEAAAAAALMREQAAGLGRSSIFKVNGRAAVAVAAAAVEIPARAQLVSARSRQITPMRPVRSTVGGDNWEQF